MRRLSDIKIAFSIVIKYRQMHPTLQDRLNAVMDDIKTVPIIYESAQQNAEEEESKMEILKEEQTEDTDDSLDKQELIDNEFFSAVDENPQTGSSRPSVYNLD